MNTFLQFAFYLVVLLALAKPLGAYMANVYEGKRTFMSPVLGWLERLVYRVAGVKPEDDMDWKRYLSATLWFNLLGFLAVYGLQRLQDILPLNPAEDGRRLARLVLQYRGELRHQHQLAGLRRRIDHELSHPDAGAQRAELPFGSDRHGGADRADARFCPQAGERHRQFLGGSHPLDHLRPAAALASCSPARSSRRAWCRPSSPTRPWSWCSSRWSSSSRRTARTASR